MKTWFIISSVCILSVVSESKLRSPQCVYDLNKYQIDALHHFNGIFGEFRVVSNHGEGSIYGPMAAVNITASNYGINTFAQKTNCESPNLFLRYGLVSKNADVDGDIYGDVWTQEESIAGEKSCSKFAWRILAPNKDYLETIWSFAPTAIRKTSKKLAEFSPDTVIHAVNTGLLSLTNTQSFNGYRVLKLPACSDRSCAAATKSESNPNILRGGNSWTGNYGGTISSDEMIIFNIPVYIGSTFTISTLNVTKNMSPCQTVYNFYAVDQSGKAVDDPLAYFTLVRSPGVEISGTILAPQARIVDSSTGYFGGQLITLQSYDGKGASIKDFVAVSGGQCSSRTLCWPQLPKVVVEVVTKTNVATVVSTLHKTPTLRPRVTRAVIQDQ